MANWSYESSEDSSAVNVVDRIGSYLNGLRPNQTATAKVGLTDQHHGSSYGVLFFSNSDENPPPYNLTGPWRKKIWTFHHNSEYPQNYSNVLEVLNGSSPENLTEIQAAYAHFCMGDYDSGVCHMTLFWQETS